MNAPRASIVITNYNYGRFIARCIDSAPAQSYPDTEVVVVDDASRDHSREIIQSYGKRVVPVLQERNGGQGAAFNAGFRACQGDVVLFLDADDWLYPDAAARVVAAFSPGVAQVQFRLHQAGLRQSRYERGFPNRVADRCCRQTPITSSRQGRLGGWSLTQNHQHGARRCGAVSLMRSRR